ncbi:molybdopterin-guanine dinucleotide biosynthesis protein A [Paenibacillus sp. UNCCL117]|uniref:molybdenum cofactor guanylyltransferase n=1 Tax=unclassified Paenibacillus TaxID=185978 RepID=UPI00088FAD90|nr:MULTISPECIES: molybdenum cofactor guanylyltransferase [unclassified Paenibacillus]SDC77919.1 molybdopterin-guanine dinucleotide biosynthesis protein A [Paenibacillus sp. cl123]SFW25935.1 molybdopterin-guanine dinucleotide biosynthesis protein A [Paenibacillus sp. UNCCL117]
MMLTGVILAGGTKRTIRGSSADLLPLASETVLERQIGEMSKLCGEMIIVTGEPRLYLEHVPRSVRIITDFYPNRGPLGGLHAALALSKYAYLWVTGSAMPFVSAELARLLLEHAQLFQDEAVLPEVKETPFPLHGIYSQSCLEKLDPLMEGNTAVLKWEALLGRISYQIMSAERIRSLAEIPEGFDLRIKNEEQYAQALQLCPFPGSAIHNYWQRGKELTLE